MSLENERIIKELDYDILEDEKEIKNLISKNELAYYENEIKILEAGKMGLSVGRLNDFQQTFLFNYLDNEVVNDTNGMKTKGNIVNSFIMSMPNHEEITNLIWETYEDDEGNVKCKISNRTLYQKWKMNAMKYWHNNAMQSFVKDFQTLLEGNLDRTEMLSEAIFQDAINTNNSDSYRIQNRKMSMEILGLKNVRIIPETDFFHTGGGKLIKETIDDISTPDYDFGSNETVIEAEFTEGDYDE